MRFGFTASFKILSYTPSPHATVSSLSSSTAIAANEDRPPTHLSLKVKLPKGKTSLVMDVELAFLKYTAFVPDAQRGVDLPGAVVRVLGPSPSEEVMRIYTPPMLVTLPTPDFSMPYNVIVMTSTVIGYMFANSFNMMTRKIVKIRVG
jgi:GPI-anchor transamidase subunit T